MNSDNNQPTISAYFLSEDFYANLKNINIAKINELNKAAALLDEPQIYGQFKNEQHYIETLKLVLASSRETRERKLFFLKKIVPSVNQIAYIDIGIGEGKLTHLIGRHFKNITLVDTNLPMLKQTQQRLRHRDVKIMHDSILDVQLPDEHYDLITLSHTLYYIQEKDWDVLFDNLLCALKTDGSLVIVLNDGLMKAELAKTFQATRYFDTAYFFHQCLNKRKNIDATLYSSKVDFQATSLSTLSHIAGLHLNDIDGMATKQQLNHFLQKNKGLPEGLYEYSIYQRYILIRKRKV